MPVGADITIDGSALPASCAVRPAGTIEGTDFETRTCPLAERPTRDNWRRLIRLRWRRERHEDLRTASLIK